MLNIISREGCIWNAALPNVCAQQHLISLHCSSHDTSCMDVGTSCHCQLRPPPEMPRRDSSVCVRQRVLPMREQRQMLSSNGNWSSIGRARGKHPRTSMRVKTTRDDDSGRKTLSTSQAPVTEVWFTQHLSPCPYLKPLQHLSFKLQFLQLLFPA